MVKTSTITSQILRLSRLPGFVPVKDGDPDDLSDTLKRYALSDEHAQRIVTTWLENSKWAPVPSDIKALAELVPVRDFKAHPDRSCRGCSGTGYETGWMLVTMIHTDQFNHTTVDIISDEDAADLRAKVDGQSQRVYSFARNCTVCRYGRALAEAAGARKQQKNTAPAPKTSPGFQRPTVTDFRELAAGDDR